MRAGLNLTMLLLVAAGGCGPAIRPLTSASPAQADSVVSDKSVVAAPAAQPLPEVLPTSPQPVAQAAPTSTDERALDIGSVPEDDSAAASWDIEVHSYRSNERVAHYVDLFSGKAKSRIQERLQRGLIYEPMIRSKFRAAGVPEDMYYLGLVESGFDPHAYSRSAAVGMWQFMSSTGRAMGLRIDWWVDERRDPVKATDAAARFLSALNQQFGSYYLAAAAYNGGPGRVARGLTRFSEELGDAEGDDKFFALASQDYLRAETRNYVPQLIAAAVIGKSPAQYGLSLDTPVETFAYDSVLVEPETPLASVALAADVPLSMVRDFNGQILRGVTPPGASVWLRLPVGRATTFAEEFAKVPAEQRIAFRQVVTQRGQTLATFAKSHGVSVALLNAYNPGLKVGAKKRLIVGQSVRLPTPAVVAAARDVPDPSIERYGPATAAGGRRVHVVRRGESLGSIAKRYRTNVATLKRLNHFKRAVIVPGQTIVVRGSPGRAITKTRRASITTSKKKTAPKKSAASKSRTRSRR